MRTLSVDIETYSPVDITKGGLYRYVEPDEFQILLFAYAWDFGPVEVIDLTAGPLPDELREALTDASILKTAYNAAFEIACLNKIYGTDRSQWECTMIHGSYCGYPLGLGACAKAMGMSEDKQKDTAGKALIRRFCVPRKPTARDRRTRVLPADEPEKWAMFIEYCRQDVVTEMAIKQRLAPYPLPEREKQFWRVDQEINDFGAQIDADLVEGALCIAERRRQDLIGEMKTVTGLENPNSPAQLTVWINTQLAPLSITIESLRKGDLPDLIQMAADNGLANVQRALELRQQLAKSSVKKYDSMAAVMCHDNRAHGLMQFFGARTGRWAGRLIQVQNLPRNYIENLDTAREIVKDGDGELLDMFYGDTLDTLSQLIRTAFVPSEGMRFAVADYSAIEARVIAWLSGEQWRLDVFNGHGRIYEASASAMFGVPIERIVKGQPEYALRAKGKVAELALGYQGSVGALKTMGALKMGLHEDELPEIVRKWRASNPAITSFWSDTEDAVMDCVANGNQRAICGGRVHIRRTNDALIITLPSGRDMFYPYPQVTEGKFGDQVAYLGMTQTTRKWGEIQMYGGKWVENIVQATARDCLADAIYELAAQDFRPVFHIHDEVVMEIPPNSPAHNVDRAIEVMCHASPWADGLPLNADGFESDYYRKD